MVTPGATSVLDDVAPDVVEVPAFVADPEPVEVDPPVGVDVPVVGVVGTPIVGEAVTPSVDTPGFVKFVASDADEDEEVDASDDVPVVGSAAAIP